MRAGALRRRVDLQTRAKARDAYGQQSSIWTDSMTGVPADIQSLTGRAREAAQAVYTEVTHLIVLRYSDLLADPVKVATMRAVYRNGSVARYFNIGAAINVDERNREINLYVSEGLNDG
ncbi:phage head closure protein [Variovorax ginsengisoli]|uniref:Phage head closure protein n=1 Tax=Variovorax ginsengisoli TaxID=363844 RepID=A0ABT8SDN9_9BURK|nr:phage head closure protein [Variovorax ginsengisoli]MDN8617870.1 phage head closure protein [Variovorax ginsengisoli]MDO1537040.1 phage head closure protein [Variovorax ginsengisoli]